VRSRAAVAAQAAGAFDRIDAARIGMREREFIAALQRAFPEALLGDDAASHRLEARGGRSGGMIVLSTDAVVEGVHFDRRYGTLSQALQKLVTSNVSDIYAIGGRPETVLLTAGLPRGCTAGDAEEIIGGLKKGTSFYGVSLAGGDTVESGAVFFFNISIIGAQDSSMPVPRGGAGVGDSIVVFGTCGGSLLGLTLLRHLSGVRRKEGPPGRNAAGLPPWNELSGILSELSIDTDDAAIGLLAGGRGATVGHLLSLAKQHLVPEARPLPDDLLRADPAIVTAMIDVSDGLARDLRNLCEASCVGAVLDEEALPVPEGLPHLLGGEADYRREVVLSSGEEYVMLATCREKPPAGTVVGTIVPQEEGVTVVGRDGRKRELPDIGYEHTF
jgi:thiamine-monophosphate kinase